MITAIMREIYFPVAKRQYKFEFRFQSMKRPILIFVIRNAYAVLQSKIRSLLKILFISGLQLNQEPVVIYMIRGKVGWSPLFCFLTFKVLKEHCSEWGYHLNYILESCERGE